MAYKWYQLVNFAPCLTSLLKVSGVNYSKFVGFTLRCEVTFKVTYICEFYLPSCGSFDIGLAAMAKTRKARAE